MCNQLELPCVKILRHKLESLRVKVRSRDLRLRPYGVWAELGFAAPQKMGLATDAVGLGLGLELGLTTAAVGLSLGLTNLL